MTDVKCKLESNTWTQNSSWHHLIGWPAWAFDLILKSMLSETQMQRKKFKKKSSQLQQLEISLLLFDTWTIQSVSSKFKTLISWAQHCPIVKPKQTHHFETPGFCCWPCCHVSEKRRRLQLSKTQFWSNHFGFCCWPCCHVSQKRRRFCSDQTLVLCLGTHIKSFDFSRMTCPQMPCSGSEETLLWWPTSAPLRWQTHWPHRAETSVFIELSIPKLFVWRRHHCFRQTVFHNCQTKNAALASQRSSAGSSGPWCWCCGKNLWAERRSTLKEMVLFASVPPIEKVEEINGSKFQWFQKVRAASISMLIFLAVPKSTEKPTDSNSGSFSLSGAIDTQFRWFFCWFSTDGDFHVNFCGDLKINGQIGWLFR